MKKILLNTLVAASMGLSVSTAQAEGNLSLYHWFDYIPQSLLDTFSKEHDVKVTMDTFDSNESMLASLKAGKMGSYDLAVPSDYMVKILASEGMLDTFKDGEVTNFGNIAPAWLNVPYDDGRKSSIPYQWGSTNFAVNNTVYKGDINTTSIIFDTPDELKGKVNVLDSQGEVLALASLHLGIPQCSTDREQLKALNSLLIKSKPNWASFGSDTAKDMLISGDAAVSMIYSGQAAKARKEGAKIDYAFPKEGSILFADNIVLLKDAPNRENAIKFVNFMLEPENVGAVSNFAQYGAGVTGSDKFMTEELRKSPELNLPATSKGHFVEVCEEAVQVNYDRIWTNLKK